MHNQPSCGKGQPYGAAAVPVITKPTSNHCGHTEKQGHSNHGNSGKYSMFISGSTIFLLRKGVMDMESMQHLNNYRPWIQADHSFKRTADHLNLITKMDKFPLLHVGYSLDVLSGIKYFFMLDLAMEY